MTTLSSFRASCLHSFAFVQGFKSEPLLSYAVFPSIDLQRHSISVLVTHAEFWERYVRFLSDGGDLIAAREALQRCTHTHCQARPEAHLFAAQFEELHGTITAARAAFELVTEQLAKADSRVRAAPRVRAQTL